jgi:hypothetical protein
MSTATVLGETSVGYRCDQIAPVGVSVRIAPESLVASIENASVRVRTLDPRGVRQADVPRKRLRRLKGFLIEISGEDAKVGFVEGGETYEYYLPAAQLTKAGIKAENQPFQMDEVEETTDTGVMFGYEFQPLACPADAFQDSFPLDKERQRKRDLIFQTFKHAQS